MIPYTIQYHEAVLKEDISKISQENILRIQKSLVNKLQINPALFGKPLRSPLQGYLKLRVGDHRIVFKLNKGTVYILAMRHRKDVYTIARKR